MVGLVAAAPASAVVLGANGSWQPIPRAPTAVTETATDVTPLSSKLHGTIDSTVLHPTTYFFEYGETTAYGARTPDAAAPFPVGA